MDAQLSPASTEEDLYCCTFSADSNKFGFMVVSYSGDGLSKVQVSETPYLYDLQAVLDDVTDFAADHKIDLTSAVASRVQQSEPEDDSSREAILITDSSGQSWLYSFEEASDS